MSISVWAFVAVYVKHLTKYRFSMSTNRTMLDVNANAAQHLACQQAMSEGGTFMHCTCRMQSDCQLTGGTQAALWRRRRSLGLRCPITHSICAFPVRPFSSPVQSPVHVPVLPPPTTSEESSVTAQTQYVRSKYYADTAGLETIY